MVKKEKIEKYSFEWYQTVFNEDKEDAKSRKLNKELYDEIYKFYKEDKDLDINIERITLKRKIGHYKGSGSTFNLQLMVVTLTILMNSFVQLAGITFQLQFGIVSAIGCFFISTFMFIYITNDSLKSKSSEKDFIHYLSLQVLDDIEKEITDEKARVKEETEKLEEQQRSQQYLNVQNEVAATFNDKIFDNTQSNKMNKGNGKCIKGFIDIIINKRISK